MDDIRVFKHPRTGGGEGPFFKPPSDSVYQVRIVYYSPTFILPSSLHVLPTPVTLGALKARDANAFFVYAPADLADHIFAIVEPS